MYWREKKPGRTLSYVSYNTISCKMYKMEEKFFTEDSGHMKINFLLTISHIFRLNFKFPLFTLKAHY